jgi:hypothetical protein
VGPEHLVIARNAGLAIQSRDGQPVSSVSVGAFWHAVGAESSGAAHDSRIVYDSVGNRWITVAVNGNLLVGASETSDPTGGWYLERIDAEAGYELDFPAVAFTRDWVAVMVNVWEATTQQFVEARLYLFTKAELYANRPSAPRKFVTSYEIPARSYDADATKLYLMDYSGGVARVSAITGPVGAESLQADYGVFASGTNAGPAEAAGGLPQMGTSQTIMNRSAVGDCLYRNQALWCASPVSVTEGSRTRQSIEWVQLDPETGTYYQIGRVDDATGTVWYAYPSIAVSRNNDVLLGYSSFSGSRYPSADMAFRYASDPAGVLRSDVVVKNGEAPYVGAGSPNRGGRSAAAVDPTDDRSLWTLQGYGELPAEGESRYGLWWAEVSSPAAGLTVATSHSGSFVRGQMGVYAVTVSNGTAAGGTNGTVTVTESLPAGFTMASMAGSGWSCSTGTANVCTRGDRLGAGTSYPPIAMTVNVAPTAPALVTNEVSVSGGGTPALAKALDPTAVVTPSTCDLNGDGFANVIDIQIEIDEVLNLLPPTNDLNHDGTVNVSDVQIEMGAALGLGCSATLPLTIPSTTLPGGVVGTAYSATVTASGGTAPYNWSGTTGLPAGLSINATSGQISGTPTAAATFTVNLKVTDSSNPQQTATSSPDPTIAINGLTITTASLPAGTVGTAYSAQLAAINGVGQLIWTAGNLPGGLTLSTSGQLTGTPAYSCTCWLTLMVTDSNNPVQIASANLSLTVLPSPIAITTSSLSSGVAGMPYSQPLSASGGVLPYTWTAASLPAGLSLNPSTGTITGTLTTAGVTYVTITVRDSSLPTPQQVSSTLSLTATSPQGPAIAVTSVAVGQNLQVLITISFTPALPSGTVLTLTSSDATQVLLGGMASLGGGELQAPLSAGTASVNAYVKATGSPGSVIVITATAPGYANGAGAVTIANSGFMMNGPTVSQGALSTYQGVTTTLTVYSGRLDSNNQFVDNEALRAGYSVNVPIASSQSSVGTVSSPVAFSGGMNSATVNFVAGTTAGSTTLSLGPISPFVTPATGASISVNVQSAGLVPFSATIGKNLQASVNIGRNGNPNESTTVTITSLDPTRLTFSTTPTGNSGGTEPTAIIQMTIPPNRTASPNFYAHAYGSSGSVAYTVSAGNYGTITSNVTLAPSGLVIQSPFGADANFVMPLSPLTANIVVNTYSLDPVSGNPVAPQAVAYGVSISAAVSAANPAIGSITSTPVVITTGLGTDTTTATSFQAAGLGSTSITAAATGYGSASVNVTVTPPQLVAYNNGPNSIVGRFLEATGTILMPVEPGASTPVLLQSNSNQLLLSADNVNWASSITVTVAANSTTANYYIQALGSSGQASYTASTGNFQPATDTISMVPSGVVIVGSTSASVSEGAQQYTISTVQLDGSDNPGTPQNLATGPLAVSLGNTNPAAGTFAASVTIQAGTNGNSVTFTPLATGSTTLSVTQPTGWTTPTSMTSVAVAINP